MHKVLFALLFLNFLACTKQDSSNPGKNTQIIRLSNADAYAITPDGRIWFMLLDKAYLVKMDSVHSYGEVLKSEQADRDRIYQQNQYNLYHPYQPPMSHADSVKSDKDALELMELLGKESKKHREEDSLARLDN